MIKNLKNYENEVSQICPRSFVDAFRMSKSLRNMFLDDMQLPGIIKNDKQFYTNEEFKN